MDQKQLEFEFDSSIATKGGGAVVVPISSFAEARAKRLIEAERAQLLAAIVQSVDHIRGSDPDAEAM